ncbi:MAG: DUF2490 domain-containing protein [Bacteroidia bacterium]
MKNIFLIILMLMGVQLFAQKQVDKQDLLWVRYDFQLKTKQFKLQQEIEERVYTNLRPHQLLIRTSIHKKLNPFLSGNIGFCYFEQTVPQDPDTSLIVMRQELRPHFTLSMKNSMTEKWSFEQRLMNELRFFEEGNNTFPYGNFRVRYQAQTNHQIKDKWRLTVFDEVMFNLGNDVVFNSFDQNRLGAFVRYSPNKVWSLDLGYFNWYQQLTTGSDYVSRNILRFTVHHTLLSKS